MSGLLLSGEQPHELEALVESRPRVPLRRGPGASPPCGAASTSSEVEQTPPDADDAPPLVERSASGLWAAWRPLMLKALVAVVGLGSVAMLGHHAQDDARYGEVLARDARDEQSSRTEEGRQGHGTEAMAQQGATGSSARAQSTTAGSVQAVQEEALAATGEDKPRPAPCVESPPERPAGITADGKVILNEANVEEFTRLRGVGQRRAEAIVALRTRLGRFRRVSDLLRIRGIGWKSLKRLKPHVVLERPVQEAPVDEPVAEPKVAAPGEGRAPADAA